jgi:hypothetical protein
MISWILERGSQLRIIFEIRDSTPQEKAKIQVLFSVNAFMSTFGLNSIPV